VILKYFSERNWLLRAQSHVSYEYELGVLPLFEWRAVDTTPDGCPSRSIFSMDAGQATLSLTVVEDTRNDPGLRLVNTCRP